MTKYKICPHCGGSLEFPVGRPKGMIKYKNIKQDILKMRGKGHTFQQIARFYQIGISTVFRYVRDTDSRALDLKNKETLAKLSGAKDEAT